MPDPYDKPGAKRRHTIPPWTWHPEKGGFWELDGSSCDFTCAEYLSHKLSGKPPDGGPRDQLPSADPQSETITKWLTDNGFTPSEPVPHDGAPPEHCGCREGQQFQCAVVYRDKESKALIHVAAFDKEFCDWGGKLSGTGAVLRFANPGDFCKRFDEAERAKIEMVFYCKTEKPPEYLSDEAWLAAAKANPHGSKGGKQEFRRRALRFLIVGGGLLLAYLFYTALVR